MPYNRRDRNVKGEIGKDLKDFFTTEDLVIIYSYNNGQQQRTAHRSITGHGSHKIPFNKETQDRAKNVKNKQSFQDPFEPGRMQLSNKKVAVATVGDNLVWIGNPKVALEESSLNKCKKLVIVEVGDERITINSFYSNDPPEKADKELFRSCIVGFF